ASSGFDDEDLRQFAVERGLHHLNGAGTKSLIDSGFDLLQMITIPDPPPNVRLPKQNDSIDNRVSMRFAALQIRKAIETLLPVLEGQTNRLPKQVRQSLRDQWEKREAQKRTGKKVPVDRAMRIAERTPERWYSQKERAEKAYSTAKKKWGEPADRFLKALAEDKTVEDASKEAGISRQTGQKYLRVLKKELPR